MYSGPHQLVCHIIGEVSPVVAAADIYRVGTAATVARDTGLVAVVGLFIVVLALYHDYPLVILIGGVAAPPILYEYCPLASGGTIKATAPHRISHT
jgi:hypothetical protein